MNPRTWRITTWWGKLIFAFGTMFVVPRVFAWLVLDVRIPGLVWVVISLLYPFAILLLGARIFRGKGEPVGARRPWWQMTARQKLSRRLGIFFAVLTALAVGVLVFSFYHPRNVASRLEVILWIFYAGFPGFLYLNSALRLPPGPEAHRIPDANHLLTDPNRPVPEARCGLRRG